MSEKPPAKSHAWAWELSILAVPVIYVMTQPPIYIALFMRESSSSKAAVVSRVGGGFSSIALPGWLTAYDRPYKWLETMPLIGQPVYRYRIWWVKHYPDIF